MPHPQDSNNDQDIYQEHVLDHYEDPYNRGHLASATHAHDGKNPLCGDKIHVDLRLDSDGRVAEAWFDGDGCVISQASASMLLEAIEGKTIEEVEKFSAEDMLSLFGPQLTPNRQKCCLLSWKVLQGALKRPVGTEAAPSVTEDDDEVEPKTSFGGPSLEEEQ
ncbi:Fe-S cluster assembly sulfur transfer protein SufU [Aporhodopirellula aestuarii]|uniref:SUF system NifU family Fe-S cluster assembly protein n=1 Tax=Aporhodopirellula aestuarii TaxID=2950107 RepID=A0ABT0TWP8_9BACT|nr:SUF system NifU family Fe-S cluster assembly protein [Aporhodopirellula aestuarii]MCM2369052.1 SUF system NifU family Fe-S cluster assembly protein [Aporhodopirellula aestuarii]